MKELETANHGFYFDLMHQDEHEDIYYTSMFTLKRDETGNIILYPDERFLNKKTCVFSHNNIIFEGDMPDKMLIAVQTNINPKQVNDILQLRIEELANAKKR